MTPFADWQYIRGMHPMRSLNDCLIFTDIISSIPMPTTVEHLLCEILSIDDTAVPPEITGLLGDHAKPDVYHYCHRWLTSTFYQIASFQYRLRAIIDDPSLYHCGRELLETACSMCDGGSRELISHQRVHSLLHAIGYEDDIAVAVRQLMGEYNGIRYIQDPKVPMRTTFTHHLIIALWVKEQTAAAALFQPNVPANLPVSFPTVAAA